MPTIVPTRRLDPDHKSITINLLTTDTGTATPVNIPSYGWGRMPEANTYWPGLMQYPLTIG